MKKTLTSLALLATIGASDVQASDALFNVSQEIHQEAGLIFAGKKAATKSRFAKLAALSEQIHALNQWLNDYQRLTQADYQALLIVNEVLNFTFHQFKNKYEQVIYTTYTQPFRQFAAERSVLQAHLKQFQDRLNGITIVEVEGLALTQHDVEQITQHAKALEEKILNAG